MFHISEPWRAPLSSRSSPSLTNLLFLVVRVQWYRSDSVVTLVREQERKQGGVAGSGGLKLEDNYILKTAKIHDQIRAMQKAAEGASPKLSTLLILPFFSVVVVESF